MVDVHNENTAHAPLPLVFAYVDDYKTTPTWLWGLKSFVPAGEQDSGLGAVFDAVYAVKPVKLHTTVQITEWEQDKHFRLESIKGFVNQSSWRFEAVSASETKLSVDFTYELPGGLAGKALGRAMEPIVALCIRHSEAALRKIVEELHAEQA